MNKFFLSKARWLSAVVLAIGFSLVAHVADSTFDIYQKHYYRTQPVEKFLELRELTVQQDIDLSNEDLLTVRFSRHVKTRQNLIVEQVQKIFCILDGKSVLIHERDPITLDMKPGNTSFDLHYDLRNWNYEVIKRHAGRDADFRVVRTYIVHLPYGITKSATISSNTFMINE